MQENEDWEKLQKWEDEIKNKEITKYGMNISNRDIPKNNKLNKILYGFSAINIIVIAVIILIIGLISYYYYDKITFQMSGHIEKAITEKYDIEAKVFGKLRNTKEKYIRYTLRTQYNGEKFIFTAIEKKGKITDDYKARLHKYYFGLWNSEAKENFIVNENETELKQFLTYEIYMKDVSNIESAVSNILEFSNFCGDAFNPDWEIYIKKGNKKIYPYKSKDITLEGMIKYISKQ